MKRQIRTKLRISGETIRTLESVGLRRAVGGMPSNTLDVAFTCIQSDDSCKSCVGTDCCPK